MDKDSFYLCTFGVCYLTSYDRITDPNVANTWYPVMTVSTNKLEGKHYTADQAKKIELKTNQIYIDLNAWMGNRYIQKYIELLKVAMEESRLVSFEYSDHRGNKTSRVVEPYQLIMKSSYWYFYGYCLKRNDFRLFKLARIYDLKVQEERLTQEKLILETASAFGKSNPSAKQLHSLEVEE